MVNFAELIISLVYMASTVTAACSKVQTRREIRDLTSAERTAYFNAVKKLHSGSNDMFSTFVSAHNNNVAQAHGIPAFFPWHRRFIFLYEKHLQSIDPSVVLPYWDWSRDSQAPELSPIFTGDYLGGNGRSSDKCVVTGVFANWHVKVPNPHCLKRSFNNGNKINAFYSAEAIEAILSQSTAYDEVRAGIEGGPHGAVHVGVGGRGGDFSTMYSPNDPIFYLHHTFIDLLWSEWQSRNPDKANTYSSGSAKTTDQLIPFNVQVQSTLNTTELCYNYPRYGTKLPSLDAIKRRGDESLMKRHFNFFRKPRHRMPKFSFNFNPFNPFNPFNFKSSQSQSQINRKSCNTKHNRYFSKHRRSHRHHSKLAQFIHRFANRHGCNVVEANDRVTKNKIRIPDPLPEQYIINNRLDIEEVRYQESLLANFTLALNDIPDFVPHSDLPDPNSTEKASSDINNINNVSDSSNVTNVSEINNINNVSEINNINNVSEINNINNVSEINNINNVSDINTINNVSDINNVSNINNINTINNVSNINNASNINKTNNVSDINKTTNVSDINNASNTKNIDSVSDINNTNDATNINNVSDIKNVSNIKNINNISNVNSTKSVSDINNINNVSNVNNINNISESSKVSDINNVSNTNTINNVSDVNNISSKSNSSSNSDISTSSNVSNNSNNSEESDDDEISQKSHGSDNSKVPQSSYGSDKSNNSQSSYDSNNSKISHSSHNPYDPNRSYHHESSSIKSTYAST